MSGTVILVRNGVTHDARVQRAAGVAAECGAVLVIGSATVTAPAGESELNGVPVVRLGGPPARARGRAEPGPPARSGDEHGAGDSGSRAVANRPSVSAALPLRARLRRAAVGALWNLRATRRTIAARPALVHANDWNTMWAAVAAKLVLRCVVVYDSHELWADRNGRWEWRPWLIACEWLFVRVADVVLTTSPGHAGALAARYRIPLPEVIRNVPAQTVVPAPGRPGLLAYVGGMMPGRGLEQAIEALPLLPQARLRAIGPGSAAYRAGLRALSERHGVADRVELAEAIAPDAVVGELSRAAVGVCLIQPICRSYELCLPNKLFEYIAAGLPVLCSDLPVMAVVVGGHGLGALAPPDDVAAIAQRARELLRPDAARDARVAAFARANTWSAEAPRLARVYAELSRDHVVGRT